MYMYMYQTCTCICIPHQLLLISGNHLDLIKQANLLRVNILLRNTKHVRTQPKSVHSSLYDHVYMYL